MHTPRTLAVLASLAFAPLAQAIEAPVLTLDAATQRAQTQQTQEPSSANVTLYWENDGNFAKPIGRTDRHYTAGVGVSVAGRCQLARDIAAYVPSWWDQFNPSDPANAYALGFVAVLEIHTPEDITAFTPDPTDAPYAGYLYGGFFLQRAHYDTADQPYRPAAPATYEHIELDLGIIGPSSQAEAAQKWIHENITGDHPNGWPHQLRDEPGADLTYVRKWRYTSDMLSTAFPLPSAFQIIPETGFTVGTVHDEAIGGSTFRLVWGALPDDFGPTRLHQPGAATGNFSEGSFSLFARPAAHLVAHNELIEGNDFRDSPPGAGRDIYPFFGELQTGVALQLFKHVELTYSVTWRTKEFEGQHGCDSFGALTLSAFWTF